MKFNIPCLFLVLLFFVHCKENNKVPAPQPDPEENFDDDQPQEDKTTPLGVQITWDNEATKISHDVYFAEYGRVHQVAGDTLLLVYHFGPPQNVWGNIAIRRSIDAGASWSEADTLMLDDDPNYYGFATPDLLVLEDGSVILAFVGRGKPDDNTHSNVQIRMSHDSGWTWDEPRIVARGRSWEPAMVQLPDGEIQLFYSSEARWWYGPGTEEPNQEILMISSDDNGASWSGARTVAYTSGIRDGMPVPVVLQENKGVVFAIESVRNSKSPWILWSSVEAKWQYSTPGTVSNNRRWLATAEKIWGGGPYLAQLPGGETLMAVHDTGGRHIDGSWSGNWKKNTMLVMVGNSMAKNFTNITYPFPDLPVDEGAIFNALWVKDEHTVMAISSRNFADGTGAVYWKGGHIVRDQ